ncbi:MAG TPA: M48 family metallopeptidase [Bryobacteraceae bacterium]|nr:M48 family metallopeptidase [Bryobacteraceae bacterium]
MREFRVFIALTVFAASAAAVAQLKTLKPGWNLFSPQQDVQLGQEAKAEVDKTKPIVHDSRIDAYIAGLGKHLAASPRAGSFPFTFQVINDKSINAFALPGGPVFINTATITAAQNEAQLAGVLAHEMSHVALRHGTHEASKSRAVELIAGLAGATAGQSMLGSLARAGINLGANSVLLHYSRDAESQADYNGAEIMAETGYDPVEMARFFQLLETKGSEGRIAQFLSDHPTPGNRVKAVQEEVSYMPKRDYKTDSPEFHRIQALVRALPPAPTAPQATKPGE